MSVAVPHCCFTISDAGKMMLRETTASTGSAVTRTTPKVAKPSVIVWARINTVMVFNKSEAPRTINSSRKQK